MSNILKMLNAANYAIDGPWFTVDSVWLPGPDVSTYVVAGFSDPHIGKPVVDAFLKDELEEGESEEDVISQADANMEFCAASMNAVKDISKLVKWAQHAQHHKDCLAVGMESPINPDYCTCGLLEIQNLIQE